MRKRIKYAIHVLRGRPIMVGMTLQANPPIAVRGTDDPKALVADCFIGPPDEPRPEAIHLDMGPSH